MNANLDRRAGAVATIASALFIVTLFLGWHETTVDVAGVVDVDATTNGWSGWGLVAGVFAALLATVFLRAALGRRPAARHLVAVGALPVGLLLSTLLFVLTGSAEVNVADTVVTETTTLWPAYLGLVLAAVASAAAFVAVAVEAGPSGQSAAVT